jgi:hypothetical protein
MSELAVLEAFVGTWDGEVTIRPGPAAEPIQMTGVSTSRLVAGKWLVVEYRASTGFEGHGIYGWDPSLGRYVGSWVDSALASMAHSEGTWDAAARILELVTETSHDGRTIRYREQRQILDDGSQIYRTIVPSPQGEFEMIRSLYRRRSSC